MLFDQEIRELDTDTEPSKPNKFVIQKQEAVPLYLAADTLEARSRWVIIATLLDLMRFTSII